MVTLQLCYDCGHCWFSKKKKEVYQCSQCGSRQVAVTSSLMDFKQIVLKDSHRAVRPEALAGTDEAYREGLKVGVIEGVKITGESFIDSMMNSLEEGETGRSAGKGVASRSEDEQPEISPANSCIPEVPSTAPAPKGSSEGVAIEDSAGGCDVVDGLPTNPQSILPAPVQLSTSEKAIFQDFQKCHRPQFDKSPNVQWLMSRHTLKGFEAKELLQKFEAVEEEGLLLI